MNKKVIWIFISLLVLVWGFFLFWRLTSKEKSMSVVFPTQEDIGKTSEKGLPLTNLRIKEKIIKLNAVKAGEMATACYTLYNTGKNPLFVEYVHPDCSCTGYEVNDSLAIPGDSLQIVLKFNTKGKVGVNFMNAVVRANTSTALYKLGFVVNVLE
ncbi:DUF1573 domain-containing protein [Paraprevotella xylaniphila]|uniref:DUF1573 domain-containing protein n=1 Tax=Paraprevotella xylaniphila TaxID=454155 RepID=UPI0023F30DDE|nr:DUF1573 domain-containing protein [Paraprevotella xylaniphila]